MKKTIFHFILCLSFLSQVGYAQVFPYSDDFESYSGFGGSLASGGWSSNGLGFGCYLNRGMNNSKAATKNLYSLSTQKDSMTSKLIGPLTSNSKLYFSHRFIDGATCNCLDYTLNPGDKLTVSISTNGTTYTNLRTFDASNDDGLLVYKTDSINLATYAGTSVSIKFTVYRGASASSDFKLDIDNVYVQDTPLSLNELFDNDALIAIFPNPAVDKLTLQTNFEFSASSVVTLYTLLGEEILNQQLSKSKTDLDLSHLVSGIYVLKIVSENRIIQKKIQLE